MDITSIMPIALTFAISNIAIKKLGDGIFLVETFAYYKLRD
jgi:hypothetical protein